MSEFIVVLVTASSTEEAERIAETLVREKLAACVNLVGSVTSIYTWEEKVQREAEHLLVIKTSSGNFSAVEERVRQLHSYSTPEIIALPIVDGSPAYLSWLGSSVTPTSSK